jgi:hypothetical protein
MYGKTLQICDVYLAKGSQIILVRSTAKGMLVGGGLQIFNLEAKQSTLEARSVLSLINSRIIKCVV